MPSGYDPLTVLQRVLLLERQQGFGDRAAIGGLSVFARAQVERAGEQSRDQLRAVAGALDGYASLNRTERERAVAAALQRLLRGPVAGAGGRVSQPAPSTAIAGTSLGEPAAEARPSPPRTRSRPRLTVVHGPEGLDEPVASIRGMRKPMPELLGRLGVERVRDLLYYFPRTHYDYTDTRSISRMRVGERTTLVGTIANVRVNRTPRGAVITTATVTDATGTAAVRWFNQSYIAKQLPVGARIAITGEPDVFHGFLVFQPRDWELIEDTELTHAARLVPMYPLTKGLYQRSLRKMMRQVVEEYSPVLEDYLPDDLVSSLRFPDLAHAIQQYHFPADEDSKAWAEQRLAFDELLLVQLGLLQRKQEWQQDDPAVAVTFDAEAMAALRASLGFPLTSAQDRVIAEIVRDLGEPRAMSRLLQGDVGSGKTVVAAAALLQVVRAGRQGVFMAPTEILAEQHYRTLERLLGPLGVRCELLLGSTPKARKRSVYGAAAIGEIDVLIGTHALIQEGVTFAALGLAITDEQHRFGVEQRASLRQKGANPHVLAMTATPIPRTLAMTIYGDLDVSAIDEMPPGRTPPITTWCRRADEAYGVVRDEVAHGHQAFVICPVIEESADSDMRSVLAEHKELQSLIFPDLKVGLLHGRMKPREKEATLQAFRAGEYDVLVATSVVEVGIDVPNATVMVIRDAHRFGLAQLHQFRGRVGRGGDESFCVLLSDSEGDDARERLEALTATSDGFALAEEDLRLRGPGEFWGTRQSGLPELKVATLGDVATIQLAREAAQEIIRQDARIELPEHALLRERLAQFWSETAELS